MRFSIKKPAIAALCICLMASLLSSAAYADEREQIIEGRFRDHEQIVTWEFPYSDDFFFQPSDQYYHDFARLSMGLSMTAFRDEELPDEEDHFLIEFLENMGFSQIETDTYRTDPTADSIAYGLAVKQIGDTTVLACGICGGGYGMEWASNLTVGDEERSRGFQEASKEVQAAIDDYMERNITGDKVKLWIAGYSRAAAVTNITAADYTEAGKFEDVYAYTFATPRTTRNPVAYPNIFNIVNKEDIVPKIPLSDWGYQRFGNDLYIKSPETDSDCGELMQETEEIYYSMFSAEMVNNAEITFQLRILFDYLLALMPDSATYSEYLQPLIVEAITEDEGIKNALKVLLKALEEYRHKDPAGGEELNSLIDYLVTMIATYYTPEAVQSLPPDQWDPQLEVLNLFYAHLAPKYLAFLYATDDPEELYSDNLDYIRLIIYGNVDASISDGSKVLKEVLADGTELVDGKPAPYTFPDVDYYEEKMIITVPTDRTYEVTVTSEADMLQTISYTGLRFSGDTLRAQQDNLYSYIMGKGDTAVIRTSVDGRAIAPSGSDYMDISVFTDAIYSPTTAMRMENNDIIHLNISGFVNLLITLIVVLLIQLGVSIGLLIRRKKKHLKRNVKVTLIWHSAMLFLFMALELSLWYFVPFIPLLKMIMSLIVFIIFFVYGLKGRKEQTRNWKRFWMYTLVVGVFMVLQNLLLGDFEAWKAILLIIVYGLFMAAAYDLLWLNKRRFGRKPATAS